jgi:sulfite reductase (NADPH) flavoprotein alpha-component
VRYAVLGLGDRGYDDFCQAAKLIDTRLEQLGAGRLHERVDCDVDFEEPAAEWTTAVLERLVAETGATEHGRGGDTAREPPRPAPPGTSAPRTAPASR